MSKFVRTPCEDVAISTSTFDTVTPQRNEKWVLIAAILGSSMSFIDGTVVNIALPALQNALHASINQLQWVIEVYTLTLAALLILGGILGDLYGRRLIFLIGVFIFTLASIGCGFASTITQLILARAIQGIGAALLIPGSLALISAAIPEERRGKAIGTWAGFTSITAAAGPLIGGWLVQHASWRWIFFLNVPFAIAVVVVALQWVSESRNEHQRQKLDIAGAVLATIGLGALVFGLIEWQYNIVLVMVAEMIGVGALFGFFWIEKTISYPMLPLEIFRSRNFSAANIITFFLYSALYGVLFFLPLNLIQVQGYTATQAGAALLPLILLIFLLSRWSGGLVKQFGPRLPLIIGPAIAAMGFALFLRTDTGGPYWSSFFPAILVLGVGMAISVAPLTTVVMNSLSRDHAGTASGVNNAVAEIAGLFAIAFFGLVMTMSFNQQLQNKLEKSSIPTTVQQEIFQQRTQLANIKTDNEDAHQIIQTSFVEGFKFIIWIAVVFALASALSARIFIGKT
jgi:EmrB/QacA subfamily drug resistance transporter